MIASMMFKPTMDSIRASLAGVAKRDIAIASVLSALGFALMYSNVHDHHADPAEFKNNTAIHFGGLLPYGFAVPLFLLVTVPLLWRRVAPLEAAGVSLAGLAINEALVGSESFAAAWSSPPRSSSPSRAGAQLTGREARTGLALLAGPGLPRRRGGVRAVRARHDGRRRGGNLGRRPGRQVAQADGGRARGTHRGAARSARRARPAGGGRRPGADSRRELDELLQRRLGELGRHGRRRRSPERRSRRAAPASPDIERESRRTLEEMRAVVGVLRDDSAGAPDRAAADAHPSRGAARRGPRDRDRR